MMSFIVSTAIFSLNSIFTLVKMVLSGVFFLTMFLFISMTQNAAYYAHDHLFFVCMNDTDRDPAGIRRNHALQNPSE